MTVLSWLYSAADYFCVSGMILTAFDIGNGLCELRKLGECVSVAFRRNAPLANTHRNTHSDRPWIYLCQIHPWR